MIGQLRGLSDAMIGSLQTSMYHILQLSAIDRDHSALIGLVGNGVCPISASLRQKKKTYLAWLALLPARCPAPHPGSPAWWLPASAGPSTRRALLGRDRWRDAQGTDSTLPRDAQRG